MTHVVTQSCCNDGRCVPVCPVQCIHPRPGEPGFAAGEQVYIDPAVCIDCGACLEECPVDAIREDYNLAPQEIPYLAINAGYFERRPIKAEAPPPGRPRRRAEGLRVAVVGAGPAGAYAAAALLEAEGVEVTMFDRLPSPHGLARAGVAPDHPRTKKITAAFDATLASPRVACLFNVEVGRDIDLADVLRSHHAVIWAAGATGVRPLGVPGERLAGCHPAHDFIGWCNGHPDFADRVFDLSGPGAVVIGAGNVALDVARLLACDPAGFARTDMADHALQGLSRGGVTEVTVVSRRGPAEAAYTLPELLALTTLEGVCLTARPEETAKPVGYDGHPLKLDIVEAAARTRSPARRRIGLRYFLAPVSINGATHVESVTFRRMASVDGELRPTEATETLPASLVIWATGYRGEPTDGLPFDPARGTLRHQGGRVVDPASGRPVPGVYCAGWIKRGAQGGLGANRLCSEETVDALLADRAAGLLSEPTETLADLTARIRLTQPRIVDFAGWARIDAAERTAGLARRAPRRKFVRTADMLDAAE
jgi:ferredoxin--NADP+ reductase